MMSKEEYWAYWNSMSHSELMIRCGLYIDRIAELEAEAGALRARLREAQEFLMQPTADQKYSQEDKMIFIENQGQWVGIQRDNVVLGVWLNELGCVVMRKVQPAENQVTLKD